MPENPRYILIITVYTKTCQIWPRTSKNAETRRKLQNEITQAERMVTRRNKALTWVVFRNTGGCVSESLCWMPISLSGNWLEVLNPPVTFTLSRIPSLFVINWAGGKVYSKKVADSLNCFCGQTYSSETRVLGITWWNCTEYSSWRNDLILIKSLFYLKRLGVANFLFAWQQRNTLP